jgi:excisionase family DNA binding protein
MSAMNLRLDLPDEVVAAIADAVVTRLAISSPEKHVDEWRLLDISKAADRLGRSTRWVREQVKSGSLPYVRLDGGAYAFELEDLKQLAIQRRIDVRDEARPRRLKAIED